MTTVRDSEFVIRETERIGPAPGCDPVERLRHAVVVYETSDAEDRVITATHGVYGRGIWTGLTWGDLRALLERLERSPHA